MRDLATFAPRWSYRRRTTSALDARAPAPPSPVLLDWDPGYSLYTDRQHAATYTQVGSGSITRVLQANGRYAGVFPGTAALVAASSPFAALADLTGGVSIYVVAERTDVAALQLGLVSIDENDGVGNPNVNTVFLAWNGNDTPVVLSFDPAGENTLDVGGPLARNAIKIVSGHVTLTQRDARVDGAGAAETSGTSRAPADLDRVIIGGSGLWQTTGVGQLFAGEIYRVIVAEGPYDAAMLVYLQGLYVTASVAASAYDGPEPENLALWWSATSPTESLDDTATEFTVAGTPTISTIRGRDCMVCSTTSDGYTGTTPWGTLADGEYTLVTLWEGPTGVAAESGADMVTVQNGAASNYLRIQQDRNSLLTRAQCLGTIGATDFGILPSWSLDTVHVSSATLRITGANWQIEAGLDGTLTDSPFLRTSGPPTDLGTMAVPNPGVSTSADGYRIWDVWLFGSELPTGFVAWATALLT